MSNLKTKLLFIEDNQSDAKLILDYTKSLSDLDLEWTQSLESAKEQIRHNTYNGILLDLGLEETYGLDTLKQALKLFNIPIIVVSGHQDPNIAKECMRLGAKGYYKKGIELDSLVFSICAAIGLAEKEKEQFTRLVEESSVIRNEIKSIKEKILS